MAFFVITKFLASRSSSPVCSLGQSGEVLDLTDPFIVRLHEIPLVVDLLRFVVQVAVNLLRASRVRCSLAQIKVHHKQVRTLEGKSRADTRL